MKALLVLAILVSTSAFAAEKCRNAVAKQLPKDAKLLDRPAVVLNPGEDDMYMMGEIWNDLNETLEYYGVSKSNGYYAEYTAVGASMKTCKIVRRITIGDSLEE